MAPSRRCPSFLFSSASVHENSSSSEESEMPLRFKILLYHDYKQVAVLPKLPNMGQGNRWIIIKTTSARAYKVEMLDVGGAFLLKRGWNVLGAIENLQEGDRLRFQQQDENTFDMWIHTPLQHPPAIGFGPDRISAPIHDLGLDHLIVNPGTPMTAIVSKTIQQVWNASSIGGPIYVCCLLISPAEGKFLIFNKEYTYLIPKQQANVAMWYVGSNIIIPGAIKTYGDGNARMVKEWPLYARQHQLTLNEVFVCKIHRGPAVWEFIGCCARRG